MAKEFFKAGIYNLYDRIEMVQEGIYEIHKRNSSILNLNPAWERAK